MTLSQGEQDIFADYVKTCEGVKKRNDVLQQSFHECNIKREAKPDFVFLGLASAAAFTLGLVLGLSQGGK